MYHKVRRKMYYILGAILFLIGLSYALPIALDIPESSKNDIDNDIIDFDEEYSMKYNKQYGILPWNSAEFNKESYRYIIDNATQDEDEKNITKYITTTGKDELNVIPIELISTTESSRDETTTEDLTVIPLSSTEKTSVFFNETEIIVVSTEKSEDFNSTTDFYELTTSDRPVINDSLSLNNNPVELTTEFTPTNFTTEFIKSVIITTNTTATNAAESTVESNTTHTNFTETSNATITDRDIESAEIPDVPLFTELDTEEQEVPEDYYDNKDIVPTPTPKTDALSVIFGFAGSVVEGVVDSVAERIFPKTLYDLLKRMQKQNEALEAERLRSREENGGIGQFTRGVIKSISNGLSRPLSQLMAGARDIGSLDSDRGFISSLASGVTSVADAANSMLDTFKDRVQAIYPGTLWCGDGHSAQARSSDLGLFFFTDTCCRQHDSCKLYIPSGETKFGLTNTGLFTRSHCSCDAKFRECLKKTNSLVSSQIGLTYFNVLGPQCFRRAHPIVKCVRRTRLTGQKCEEYELDYTKPKMWQWFDNESY
ncbi:uncharacterized protein LOC110996401 [Pieris rapae]|uniref:uncharacterized protein LOC110996401 n=1 Tax=Pieris rapae TaxID=64459 RepID=UPI001E27E7D4|nr:uncharacterized protein LOC110996401 [Pieris rapae]